LSSAENRIRFVTILAVILTVYAVSVTISQFLFGSSLLGSTLVEGSLAVLFFVAVMAFLMDRSPRSYRVALVGFPQSGKTTLLISLFGEAFARRIYGVKMTPRGSSTIERVNAGLARLQTGRAVGPTMDQDLFAFRADISFPRLLFPFTYKTEFGDFAGHDSERYSSEKEPWLHTTEFFKWVADSDAMIFVVDLGYYVAREEARKFYIARMSSALRAAWQHFLDVNSDRINEVKRHPLVLAFTKVDLLAISKNQSDLEHEVTRLGFGEDVPEEREISMQTLVRWEAQVKDDFSELIRYFAGESKLRVVFTSSFAHSGGQRIGIEKLLLAVLPR